MASKATFSFSKEGERVYDWPEVIGQDIENRDDLEQDDANLLRQEFEAMPYERKAQMFQEWYDFTKEIASQSGYSDFTKLDNYAANQRGYLAEQYGDTDTLGEEITGAIGKTYEGIADRARFYSSPEVVSKVLNTVPWKQLPGALGAVGDVKFTPEMIPQSVDVMGQTIPGPQQIGNTFADRAQELGQNLQGGTVERSGIFDPRNPRWWAEKALPTLGGLFVDLGIATTAGAASGGTLAGPAFSLSAAGQMGGSVLEESKGAYQKQAEEKYKARLESGMRIAEARTLLRGELNEADEKAAAEATVIATVSGILNSFLGVGKAIQPAVMSKITAAVASKNIGQMALKGFLGEAVQEVLDEVAQDAGRLGRDIGTFPERWEQYKQSSVGERYATAGLLGGLMGGGVNVAIEAGTALNRAQLNKQLQERGITPPEAPQSPVEAAVAPEPATPPEAPTAPTIQGELSMALTPQQQREVDLGLPPITDEIMERMRAEEAALAAAQPEPEVIPETVVEPVVIPEAVPITRWNHKRGDTVSWLNPQGELVTGTITSPRGSRDIEVDGVPIKSGRWRMFKGTITPKNNTLNMQMGDALFDGQSVFRYLGNGEFYQGANVNGQIDFDRFDPITLDLGMVNDPRMALYDGAAFKAQEDAFNSRENPNPKDKFGPYLATIGEKNEQAATVDQGPAGTRVGPEATADPGSPAVQAQEEGQASQEVTPVAPFNNTPPGENASLGQLRAELVRRARLDRSRPKQTVARFTDNQIDTMVNLVAASADAIASRTGQNRDFILARITFGHERVRGDKRGAAGVYDTQNRKLNLFANASPATLVHEWGHFVLREHIYNPDQALNILSMDEKKVLESFIQSRLQGKKSLRAGRPTVEMEEYFAGMLEKVFQQRYYEGNRPAGIPEQIFNILKKVGDFVRQVYSKARYTNIASDLDGSVEEQNVLNLLDRIFVPDQIETLVRNGTLPPDVTLPSNNITEPPNIDAMAANFEAQRASNVRSKVSQGTYRTLDRLDAEGRLSQTVEGQSVRQGQLRQPMQAKREFDRILDDGIDAYATLAKDSTYERQARDVTRQKASDFLGKMTTGEAIAWFMGDPYTGPGTPKGAVLPDVMIPAMAILATKLRRDLSLLPTMVTEGKITTNESMEIASLYEKFLKYTWETGGPSSGRAVDFWNSINETTSTRARADRLLGMLGATESKILQFAESELGGERFAWIRNYAERYRAGEVTQENYFRRVREFKLEFQRAFPQDQQAAARGYIDRASRLFQTLLDSLGANLPTAVKQAFGNKYWFSPALWEKITGVMAEADQLPPDSWARHALYSEVTALLATEAQIPLGQQISAHFMAAYLCGPSTIGVSVVGNMVTMATWLGAVLIGGRTQTDAEGKSYVNPNIRYLPQMIESIKDSYGVGVNNNGIKRGAAWRNVKLALQGFGGATRFQQGRYSSPEIYRQAIKYGTPTGALQNAQDIVNKTYSMLQALPYRLLSVADAAVGTGAANLATTVAAAQAAEANANRFKGRVTQNPASLDPRFNGNINRATQAFYNAEYNRLMGYTPEQLKAARVATEQQVNSIMSLTALRGSKTATNRKAAEWAIFQQQIENMRNDAFGSNEQEALDAAAPVKTRQEIEDEITTTNPNLTAQEVQQQANKLEARYAIERQRLSARILNAYQQEQEFVKALASFSYRPKGIMSNLVNAAEGISNALTWRAGRWGEKIVFDDDGNPMGFTGGVNVGDVALGSVLLPFLRAQALSTSIMLQMTPFGFLSAVRGKPLGSKTQWNRAEQTTFQFMTIAGSMVLATLVSQFGDDDDPLEPGKWHVIGPMPGRDKGKKLRDRGIKPNTKYYINADGSVVTENISNIPGIFSTPLLTIGAFNSVKWSEGENAEPQSPAGYAWSTAVTLAKMAYTTGPMGQLTKYTRELLDDTVGKKGYAVQQALGNLGADGLMFYRRFFNEMGAMINATGRSIGLDWEPDMKKVPALENDKHATNAWRSITSDYLFFNSSGRDFLNGYGEPLPEDGDILRKYVSTPDTTPINKLLAPYSLTLAPVSRYRTNIRKGDTKGMREFFANATAERAERLPRHLIGVLTNEENHEFMKDYYRPLLKTSLEMLLKRDPYKHPEVVEKRQNILKDPVNNLVDNTDQKVQQAALQEYVNEVRSKVEAAALASYLADKNPALDSQAVTDYIEDMEAAIASDSEP